MAAFFGRVWLYLELVFISLLGVFKFKIFYGLVKFCSVKTFSK